MESALWAWDIGVMDLSLLGQISWPYRNPSGSDNTGIFYSIFFWLTSFAENSPILFFVGSLLIVAAIHIPYFYLARKNPEFWIDREDSYLKQGYWQVGGVTFCYVIALVTASDPRGFFGFVMLGFACGATAGLWHLFWLVFDLKFRGLATIRTPKKKLTDEDREQRRQEGRCPECGFGFGWDGTSCRHCKYGQ
jgi:hypothetical protein